MNSSKASGTGSAEFRYGPVEMYLIGFEGERPGQGVVDAILDLVQSETVRLLDLLFISRAQDGSLTVLELEEMGDPFGLETLDVIELGLAGEEDIDDLAEAIKPGTSSALLVVEHLWALKFAEALFLAGGSVLNTHRIPAPVVNEMIAAATA